MTKVANMIKDNVEHMYDLQDHFIYVGDKVVYISSIKLY
jgi:hypothetical protein